MRTHLYAEDPDVAPDHRGDGRCTCGLPEGNRAHELQRRRYEREGTQERT